MRSDSIKLVGGTSPRSIILIEGITETARARVHGADPSMDSVGDCYDNAMCEIFFATLECELLGRTTFRNRTDARRELFQLIEAW